MAYLRGESRDQINLLPEALEDYVAANALVRFIDRFIDSLNLKELGFNRIQLASTGRPPYSPGCLLRLYLYGYLHQCRSSRQLARQARCNVELMWLLEKLTPEFKTIAQFRRDNGAAIGAVVGEFRAFCRELGLYGQEMVAIDGSFFKAVNSKDQVLSDKKLEEEQRRIEKQVEKYLEDMDRIDAEEEDEVELTAEELEEKIRQMEERMRQKQEQQKDLKESGESHRCLTDPDARMLRKGGKTEIGYNVQIAVDDKHHLIAEHAVTNAGNDAGQLGPIAKGAKENLSAEKLIAVADSGYHTRGDLKACAEANITTYVAERDSSSSRANGRFGKRDFAYDEAQDVYICPAGEVLKRVGRRKSKTGETLFNYRTTQCRGCGIRDRCIKPETQSRQVTRWEHETLIDANKARLKAHPEMMSRRKSLAEHPFGTFKRWMGQQHFLLKRTSGAETEMNLMVLAYNIKRVVQVLGVDKMMKVIEERRALA